MDKHINNKPDIRDVPVCGTGHSSVSVGVNNRITDCASFRTYLPVLFTYLIYRVTHKVRLLIPPIFMCVSQVNWYKRKVTVFPYKLLVISSVHKK